MVNRRTDITMTDDELVAYVGSLPSVVCATNGPRGWPHLSPLWFLLAHPLPEDGMLELRAWTYRRSQKVRNLEREPRATLLFEDGETYEELRGAAIECEVTLIDSPAEVLSLGRQLLSAYAAANTSGMDDDVLRHQATKRVGLCFRERRRTTWDHRKLAGV